MKTLTAIFLIFFSSVAFSQTSAYTQKTTPALQQYYVDHRLIGITDTTFTGKTLPIYQKYIPTGDISDSLHFMVDSNMVNSNYITYLDPNEIENINVSKGASYPNGIIYIKLKSHVLLSRLLSSRLLSFGNLANRYIAVNEWHKPVIYLLDNKLITDTTGKRIPEICLAHVTVAEASDMSYFKMAMPDVLIMMITTKPVSTKPYQEKIFIRGATSN